MDKEIVRTTKIAVFRNKKVRKIIYKDEWWFSIIDIVKALTESDRPRKYWNDLKKKLIVEGYSEVSEKIGQLKLEAPDGKMRETDCANTETMFRIIQSIPSPKAEPLKRWLARVGDRGIEPRISRSQSERSTVELVPDVVLAGRQSRRSTS